MERWSRHRYAITLPFVAFLLVALVGGIVNGATASGRIVDDFNGEPVKDAQLSVGKRSVSSGPDGTYEFPNVPRTTSIRVDVAEYNRANIGPTGGEVRLVPITVRVEVNVEGTQPPERVASAQIRQEARVLGTTGQGGIAVLSPHPGRDAKVLVCAAGFRTKEVVIDRVVMVVALVRAEGSDCPPVPTPTPNPNAPSPSPSPAASQAVPPAASPSPSPTGR